MLQNRSGAGIYTRAHARACTHTQRRGEREVKCVGTWAWHESACHAVRGGTKPPPRRRKDGTCRYGLHWLHMLHIPHARRKHVQTVSTKTTYLELDPVGRGVQADGTGVLIAQLRLGWHLGQFGLGGDGAALAWSSPCSPYCQPADPLVFGPRRFLTRLVAVVLGPAPPAAIAGPWLRALVVVALKVRPPHPEKTRDIDHRKTDVLQVFLRMPVFSGGKQGGKRSTGLGTPAIWHQSRGPQVVSESSRSDDSNDLWVTSVLLTLVLHGYSSWQGFFNCLL